MKQMRRASVRQWLLRQPPESVVGVQNCANGCPLATYMGGHVRIGWEDYYDERTFRQRTLDAWAKALVRSIDFTTVSSQGLHEIQAWQVLEILDRIP